MSSSEGENLDLDNVSGSESEDYAPAKKVRTEHLTQLHLIYTSLDQGTTKNQSPEIHQTSYETEINHVEDGNEG
jgi:hypothetical protein